MLLPNLKQIQQNLTIYQAVFFHPLYVHKKQTSHLPTQTPLIFSNLLLELQIFAFLQLSSNSLPTSMNVPIFFSHFFAAGAILP